ncbi:MAG: universal stress protein [Gammaproteobacteria bacterium]|nr:universal stress protein [Gammaproteobacteria bacterium]
MLELKNVLVVLDPEQEEQPSLDKVLTLARVADFDITLLSCEYTQYLVEGYYFDAVDLPRLRQELLDERTEVLERLAGPLRENGLTVDTLAVWGHPAYETVIRQAHRVGADLVVAHTRQHSSRLANAAHPQRLAAGALLPDAPAAGEGKPLERGSGAAGGGRP